MDTTSGAVRALLASRARDKTLAAAAADMAERAIAGAPFGTPHALFADARKAIAGATGLAVERTVIDTPGSAFARIAYSVDYFASLGSRVRERHWPRLEPLLAASRSIDKNAVWDAVIADGRRHGLSAWDDPFAAPQNTPGENLLTTIFYFVAFAAVGDGAGMEPLANLVRLLPYAVPIGERPAGSGEWLVALHPAAP